MHVRVRLYGKPEVVVSVESKLTKIDKFRVLVQDKFDVKPSLQRLFYGGKLLDNGYTFHDYNIKLNDVIQLMVQTQVSKLPQEEKKQKKKITVSENRENIQIEYKDAVSMLYTVGDFIDMRDTMHGAWFEGRIVRIVSDPATHQPDINSYNEDQPNKENDPDIKQPPVNGNNPKNGIEMFFSKTPKQPKSVQQSGILKTEDHLLYNVLLERDEEDSNTFCKLKDIRPRARNVVTLKDLKIGQKVMINHNSEYSHEKGYWYDFKVSEIVPKRRNIYELMGTIYLGPDSIPQNDTKVRVHDKIFAIEEVIPLEDRTEEYKELMKTQPETRSVPLNCLMCRDNDTRPCQHCGCFLCSGKQCPEKILLCDECNKGFHMECLDPPLTELPIGDWYCPMCKRDVKQVVAPGAAKQKKRQITTNRDWGRGMACVGKTKSCSMPPNHFGPIPGIDVGMCWRFRIQLSESGVHRPPVSGIHGRDVEGAYSIVLSGGYEDDVDHGNEFTYTGSGGRDLSGNKRTAEQSCDQRLIRENRALARNCAVKRVNEEGDDAGDDWREGRPVRVVRSCKMAKHFPKYAPTEGIRYDGIYKVVKYYPEKGKSGFRVWKYLLRRDDPSPAPWEAGAKHYGIIYPDGYLEAEAEKKALKDKNANGRKGKGRQPTKRALQESNQCSNDETVPLAKKQKAEGDEACEPSTAKPSEGDEACDPSTAKPSEGDEACEPSTAKPKKGRPAKTKSQVKRSKIPPEVRFMNMLAKIATAGFAKSEPKPEGNDDRGKSTLSEEEKGTIALDTLNAPLWEECLVVCAEKGKKEFVEHVTTAFLCIICQEVAASPVTTPCLHNFCLGCLKQAFKATGSQTCPCCRRNLSTLLLEPNDRLKAALRSIMAGYDANRT